MIARALNVPLEALVTGQFDETYVSFKPVPLLAEIPTSPEFEPSDRGLFTVPIPTDQLPDRDAAYFACPVQDESMAMAGLMPGAIAVVRRGAVLDNGKIAAVVSEGEGYLRYVIFYPHMIVLQPANPIYQPTLIPRVDKAALKVIGKLILAITPY